MHVTAHTHTHTRTHGSEEVPATLHVMNNEGSTFSREHLNTFCKINIEAQKNKDSWIYQLIEKGWEIPQLQGCCFPLSLPRYQMQRSFMSFSHSIWSNKNKISTPSTLKLLQYLSWTKKHWLVPSPVRFQSTLNPAWSPFDTPLVIKNL